MPFTDKGKLVSPSFFRFDTGTENQDSEKNPGPMGTGSATSANSTCSIAYGHQKADNKSPVTTAHRKKWCVLSLVFGSPTRNSGIGQEERGHSPRRGAGWR